jgi:hypothetical protein
MWMKRMALGLVVLTAAAGGCGAGEDSTTSDQPAPLPREIARKASALCDSARLEAERKGLKVFRIKARVYERDGTINEYKGFLRRQEIAIVLAPSLRSRVGEVRAFLEARGVGRQVEDPLEEIGAAARLAVESPTGFLESGGMRKARDLARRYGIEACAVLYEQDGLYDKGSAMPGTRFTPRSSK